MPAALLQPSEELWAETPRDTPTPSGSRRGSAALEAPTNQGAFSRTGSAGGGLASVPEV